ncbi:hypothetical protein CDAR_305841 [Caerostris darwini]|uniref:Uncharacterized protein n=1 Tax=Caerostris darwini TaxID=1538125 RepID=A0AAV4VQV1_9ARAC|nr:hypothetical protein CDAR_305841 [Caerostris darwini]
MDLPFIRLVVTRSHLSFSGHGSPDIYLKLEDVTVMDTPFIRLAQDGTSGGWTCIFLAMVTSIRVSLNEEQLNAAAAVTPGHKGRYMELPFIRLVITRSRFGSAVMALPIFTSNEKM